MPPVMVPREEQSEEDLAFLDIAIKMAEEASAASEIPVGCVFVREGRVLAKGRNRTNETRNASLHAELDALSHIIPSASSSSSNKAPPFTPLTDVTLYVTVEPCLMCASALRQVGIRKVYYGCANDRFGGCGGVLSISDNPALIHSEPFVALGGYRREEAIMLLRKFYMSTNVYAPNPRDKSKRVLKTEITPLEPGYSPAAAGESATVSNELQSLDTAASPSVKLPTSIPASPVSQDAAS